MKKIVASVGLVALGASGIQSVSAQTLAASPDTSKMWSVAATLRGFYDDNTATLPSNATLAPGSHRGSFGFEVSPSAALAWSLEQTTINLGVMYSLKYYDNTPPNSTGHDDQVFTFNAGVSHAFNENLKGRVSDSFVIGQEPDLLRAGNTFATFQRVSGDNIRNYGSIGLDDQFTPQFGVSLGYDNGFYDYKDTGVTAAPTIFGPAVVASTAGALNRIEQRVHVDAVWGLQPETKALIGYQFTDIGYTADQPISGLIAFPSTVRLSDSRNYREHTVYVGGMHDFSPQLNASLKIGASYTDYYNDSTQDSSYTPYVSAMIKYAYAPESSVQGGISYDQNATDVIGLTLNGNSPGGVTLSSQSGVVFATVNHRIAPNLFGSLNFQFQNNLFTGGQYDGEREQYYLVGLDVEYRFNPYFSTHIGYNYDDLVSNVAGRGFDRNRVYVGVTASY